MHEPLILAPDAKAWLREVIKAPFESFYGYGWRVLEKGGERIVFHGGWVGGFCSFIGFLPKDRVGIVVLNNSESPYALKTGMNFLLDVIASR